MERVLCYFEWPCQKKKKIHFGLMSLKHHFKITSDTFHITAVCLRISHSVVVMVVRKFAC